MRIEPEKEPMAPSDARREACLARKAKLPCLSVAGPMGKLKLVTFTDWLAPFLGSAGRAWQWRRQSGT